MVLLIWLLSSSIVDAMQMGKRVVKCQLPGLSNGFFAAWYRTQECQNVAIVLLKRRRMLLGIS